jgi:regulator of sigma E protease
VDLLYFTLLISTLIFVHESGHFAFAKIFGVKVLTFSIGFGPTILKIRGKETEYCAALVPFGGFVKMLEETRGPAEILPEERKRTFESQALWKRVVIVLAGPAMNVLFPILLYTSVFLEDKEFAPPTVGVVIPGKPAFGKLMAGDRISAIGGHAVSSFQEIQQLVASRAGVPTVFSVVRDNAPLEIALTPADETHLIEPRELDIVEHVGQVGFHAGFAAPVIGVPRADSPAFRAGLRTFDRITSISGRRIDRYVDLVQALAANKGDTVAVAFERPAPMRNALGGLCDIAVLEPQVATLTALAPGRAAAPLDENAREADVLSRTGIESADMYVAFAPEDSSEWKAGLRAGDRITALDGSPMLLWQARAGQDRSDRCDGCVEETLFLGADKTHTLSWTRSGAPMEGVFHLRKEEWSDEFGQHYERYVFRTTHWMPSAADALVPNPSRLSYAVVRGFEETFRAVRLTAVTFARLIEGRLSLSNVSGPITIYDMAGQAGAKGTTYFVWAMAFLSINIGLVNLLPIPVLDGGHLFFLAAEAVKKRPLPLRIREVASLVGMTVLFALMLVAFKNDVEKRWDVIVGQLRELFG